MSDDNNKKSEDEKIFETVHLDADAINEELEREELQEQENAPAEPAAEGVELEYEGLEPAADGADSPEAGNPEEPEPQVEDLDSELANDSADERAGAEDAEGSYADGPEDLLDAEREAPEGKEHSHNPFKAIGTWFKRLKGWQRVIAIVLIVVIAVGAAGYGYFHSKYILMDYSTGEFHSDEDIASAAEQSTQDAMENEELEKRQLVEEIPEQSVVESTQEVEKATGVVNILLIGTDDRTKKFSKNARGDTCILLSINNDQNKAHLVSFERATGVKVLSGEYEGQWDWLTHMFWYGGPAMMTEEIRDNFKVDVTKYIRVNIYTFMELLESIDGVDIELTQAEADNINHPGNTYTAGNEKRAIALGYTVQTDLVAGMNHLDPGTAMCYARLRAIDDDWHRVVRQRKVILAAIEKLKTMSLTDLDNLLNNVLPLVQTNLTETDVASLLPDALNFVNMDYDSITFPLRHTYGLMDGMEGRKVLAVDFDTNSQELQNLLYGDATTEELTEKYENTPSDYNYKDSDTYQQNYQDAETVVGKSTDTSNDTGVNARSGAVSGTTTAGTTAGTAGAVTQSAGADNAAGTDAAAGQPDPVSSTIAGGAGNASAGSGAAAANTTGTAGSSGMAASTSASGNTGTSGTAASTSGSAAGTTAGSSSSSGGSGLGSVVSSTTDPATGVVTTIYYNEKTGVRTVVANHPSSGATTVSTTDTATGNTQTVHSDAYGNVTTQTSNTGTSATAAGTGTNNAAGTPAGTAPAAGAAAGNAAAGTQTGAAGATAGTAGAAAQPAQ